MDFPTEVYIFVVLGGQNQGRDGAEFYGGLHVFGDTTIKSVKIKLLMLI